MKGNRMFERWVRFNGVGALGIAVQLGILACLVRWAGVHYLLATAVAVEAAVLHNFWWHERWTWRDRRARSRGDILRRLVRFHTLNGTISIAGSLLIVKLLTGFLQFDPIVGNIAAIAACSIANFAASEVLVFTRATAAAAALLLAVPAVAAASPAATEMIDAELQAHTLQAWTKYEEQVEARHEGAAAQTKPFFALDAFGNTTWRKTALAGGVAMAEIDRPAPGGPEIGVPDGKIHHWVGAVFVPKMSIETLLDRLSQLAGNESKHYEDVIASKLLGKDGSRFRIYMKLRRTKVITVTYNTENAVEYTRLGAMRAKGRSVSTRIAELEDAGTPNEREKPVGSDGGYLWRLNAYWRYEAVDGGVLIECESVSLSRSVPLLLRPFITGIVEGLARESLERTLIGLRSYLTASR